MKHSFAELLSAYLTDELSQAELDRFFSLMEQPENRKMLEGAIDAKMNDLNTSLPEDAEQITQAVSRLTLAMEQMEQPEQVTARIPFTRRYRWVAAAVFLLMATGTVYVLLNPKNGGETAGLVKYKGDVAAPVITKATLTLADGKQIVLDSVQTGSLAADGAEGANKTAENALAYNLKTTEVVQYHTLTNPKGSKPVELTLADGSKAWLNTASSITFPTAFTAAVREVTITGEAYFEVVHNEKQPFRVKAGNQTIEDIGTAFNVNAYSDEPSVKTTLVEGSIRIGGAVLKPGQQYYMDKVEKGNVDQAVAWKNGFFSFEQADITTVMRQLQRWYDVEVRYEGAPNIKPFQGDIGRGLTLAQLLKGLEQVHVHFRIEEDKRIVILP